MRPVEKKLTVARIAYGIFYAIELPYNKVKEALYGVSDD